MSKKTLFIIIGFLVLFISGYIVWRILFPPQSMKFSRLTGSAVGIKIPKDCKKIINVSFVRKETETVKYLTYVNTKGELLSVEYRDQGLYEGKIK